MADVAARNKRLKHKMHMRRESDRSGSSADGSKKIAEKVSAKEAERRAMEKAREERNKERDRDTKIIQENKIKAILAEKRQSGTTPLPSPSPLGSPLGTDPKSSPKVVGSTPLASPTYPGRQHSTWADATDEFDLGIQSSDYATSTTTSAATSAASSYQNTPIHSGQMPTRTLGGRPSRKVSNGSLLRQISDPSSETASIQHHLDALARQDTRTFEGTVGDMGLQGRNNGPPTLPGMHFQSPAAIELAKRQKGQTPLKLSGERSYHPEPDSPGLNGTNQTN